jgi:hypothetical protein
VSLLHVEVTNVTIPVVRHTSRPLSFWGVHDEVANAVFWVVVPPVSDRVPLTLVRCEKFELLACATVLRGVGELIQAKWGLFFGHMTIVTDVAFGYCLTFSNQNSYQKIIG